MTDLIDMHKALGDSILGLIVGSKDDYAQVRDQVEELVPVLKGLEALIPIEDRGMVSGIVSDRCSMFEAAPSLLGPHHFSARQVDRISNFEYAIIECEDLGPRFNVEAHFLIEELGVTVDCVCDHQNWWCSDQKYSKLVQSQA